MSAQARPYFLDFISELGDSFSIKPAAPLHVCAIRRVFFLPETRTSFNCAHSASPRLRVSPTKHPAS